MSDYREITIYTWGIAKRKFKPHQSKKNFNVCGVSNGKPYGINLKKLDGRSEELQKSISSLPRYEEYKNAIIKYIIGNPDSDAISINCQKGRHRSVAMAQLVGAYLANEHNIIVNIKHLELK